MLLWLAAIAAALLLVACVRLAHHLRVLQRSERARDAELAEHGVDITIAGPVDVGRVVLGDVDGMTVHATGFTIATATDTLEVPRGTWITLAREPIVRDGKAVLPAGASMRAVRAP